MNSEGRETAMRSAEWMKSENMSFDIIYTSVLKVKRNRVTSWRYKNIIICSICCFKRAIQTTEIVIDKMNLGDRVKVVKDWRLCERHYGNLTGKMVCLHRRLMHAG